MNRNKQFSGKKEKLLETSALTKVGFVALGLLVFVVVVFCKFLI